MQKLCSILFIVVVVFVADQWTKQIILGRFSLGEVESIIPGFFNLTLAYNTGAAFGLWTSLDPTVRRLVLFGTTALALGAVLYFFRHPAYQNPLPCTGLSLILGGAVGNLYDRLTLHHVVDFLDVYYGTYHWPAFNIADSCICIGVGLLILYRPVEVARPEAVPAQ